MIIICEINRVALAIRNRYDRMGRPEMGIRNLGMGPPVPANRTPTPAAGTMSLIVRDMLI